jgi:hypothetical protein
VALALASSHVSIMTGKQNAKLFGKKSYQIKDKVFYNLGSKKGKVEMLKEQEV